MTEVHRRKKRFYLLDVGWRAIDKNFRFEIT